MYNQMDLRLRVGSSSLIEPKKYVKSNEVSVSWICTLAYQIRRSIKKVNSLLKYLGKSLERKPVDV